MASSADSVTPLSLSEKVLFAGCLFKTLYSAAMAAAMAPFQANRAHNYLDHVLFAAIRTLTGSTTVRQMQAVGTSTFDTYCAFLKSIKLSPDVSELDHDARGCWLGPADASKVVLYLHGGGYVGAGSPAHMQLVWETVQEAEKSKGPRSLSIFFLCYDLAPQGQYPRQLQQASAALKYLMERGIDPSKIIIAGDSAGGNLALALISHLTTPHPLVTPVPLPKETSKLLGIILLSPWVSFSDKPTPSTISNANKDCLSHVALLRWSAAFMGEASSDWYSEPLTAPVEWWTKVLSKVEGLLMTGGADELFVDDIEGLAKKFRAAAQSPSQVEIMINQHEAHDEALMDYLFRRNQKSKSTLAFWAWLVDRL